MSDDTAPNKKKPVMPKDSIEVQAMFAALVSQHAEIEALRRKLKTTRAEVRSIKARVDFAERFYGGRPSPIPDDVIARLIRLCHPDKHSNCAAANEATAWLLAQRSSV